jgi:hypothetical protein
MTFKDAALSVCMPLLACVVTPVALVCVALYSVTILPVKVCLTVPDVIEPREPESEPSKAMAGEGTSW